MRIHKTQPAAVFPHRDPVLGLDWVRLVKAALRSDTLLETWHDLFTRSVARTFWVNTIGSWVLMTCEPDNIKAILATQFETWPIGGLRQRTITHVLGPHAIFSTNAGEWARARALIRPSFVRNQIADLECTDRHVENLLARLQSPSKADKVDLQALFYMFTMDTSTDFMFGHSTDMLVSPSSDAVEFTKAFDYALRSAVGRARKGWLHTSNNDPCPPPKSKPSSSNKDLVAMAGERTQGTDETSRPNQNGLTMVTGLSAYALSIWTQQTSAHPLHHAA
ncbi:cytochrome P450 52E2 [Ophiocordyceps sinensis CO18]|uniref:Cytochrome P450 52E2 n=1 Tax=Ophiocordyceps sinensis (strain Co18 / CGMCC 3.14243) TaxID=911162 RepID=T5AM32_OPHSC|nr:cytochrome P450 52E2 [Ophiocordyceps sinensis CO18]